MFSRGSRRRAAFRLVRNLLLGILLPLGAWAMQVAFDEMTAADGAIRAPYTQLSGWLNELPPDILNHRRREAEVLFRRIGITFAVYGEADAQERLIPFDVLPRIISAGEWDLLRRGLEQRV